MPSSCQRTRSGLLVEVDDVGGAVVVVAIEVEGTVVVVLGVATSWNPRQPSMAAIAASPMTAASRNDHRR